MQKRIPGLSLIFGATFRNATSVLLNNSRDNIGPDRWRERDEIFLCYFLDDRRWDNCRSKSGAGERHAGAQSYISRRALHRFGFYPDGRRESAAGFEL